MEIEHIRQGIVQRTLQHTLNSSHTDSLWNEYKSKGLHLYYQSMMAVQSENGMDKPTINLKMNWATRALFHLNTGDVLDPLLPRFGIPSDEVPLDPDHSETGDAFRISLHICLLCFPQIYPCRGCDRV